jgi:hypothetical protein
MDRQRGCQFMHGRQRQAAAERRIDRRNAKANRMLGIGQCRGIGLYLRHLMPKLVQCLDPDGLHGLSTRTHVLCLFY